MVFGSSGVAGGGGALANATRRIEIGGLVADLGLSNLDTMVQPLEVLKAVPGDPRLLDNTLSMGLDMETNPARSMGVSAKVSLSIVTEDRGSIEHDLYLALNMEAASVDLRALLEIARPRLHGFPVRDVLELRCWLATLNAP